jgi:hypothetical protein
MAHYDDATKDFMVSVVDEKTDRKPGTAGFVARQAMGLAKDLKRPGGKAKVEAAIARRVLSLATKTTLGSMEKEAGVSSLALYNTLNEYYKSDWHQWEAETIWQTLELERGIEPTEEIRNMVQALQVICKTNFPFEDFSTFENVGHALNMNPVHFDTLQPLEPEEAALTVKILQSIRPKEEFEDDVLGYIAACCLEAGMVALPTDLFPEGTQELLDKMSPHVEPDLVQEALTSPNGEYDTESMVGVQRERIREVREYIDEMLSVS